jgi:SAM-dependent methyltransferase
MLYDPIKNIFASVIRKVPSLRIVFYKLLDLMFLRSWYVRRELREIRKKLHGKISIYDAGTGFGQYTYYMSKHLVPASIYAVDVKEDWICDLREFFSDKPGITFGIADLRTIDHTEEFDLIVCIDVMEHIEEDVKVFQNFYKALRMGGYLLINSPSTFGGSDVHDEGDESFVGEHARDGYSAEDLETKLIPIGFKTYKSRYTYGYWGERSWRLGIKYPMQMLNLSKVFLVLLPFYYIITFPFTLIMMYLDYISDNTTGSGINFIAKKTGR